MLPRQVGPKLIQAYPEMAGWFFIVLRQNELISRSDKKGILRRNIPFFGEGEGVGGIISSRVASLEQGGFG